MNEQQTEKIEPLDTDTPTQKESVISATALIVAVLLVALAALYYWGTKSPELTPMPEVAPPPAPAMPDFNPNDLELETQEEATATSDSDASNE